MAYNEAENGLSTESRRKRGIAMQYDAFREGCAAYRPLALWSLNHALEEDELRRQVAAMDEQRLAGFILHPRSGLLTPCMSEDCWLRLC